MPPEDAPRLAETVLALVDDAERCTQLGAQGRCHAEDHLALEGVLSQFEQDCQELLPAPAVTRVRQ